MADTIKKHELLNWVKAGVGGEDDEQVLDTVVDILATIVNAKDPAQEIKWVRSSIQDE